MRYAQKGPQGIVVVAVEGLRADKADALAALTDGGREWIRFTDVASTAPLVRPAMATLLTGLASDRTSVRDNVADRLPPSVVTLPEALGAAGWATAAFVASPFVGPGSGLDRGFELFDGTDLTSYGVVQYVTTPRDGAQVVKNFGTWLDSMSAGARWFAVVELSDLAGLATHGAIEDATPSYEKGLSALNAALEQIRSAIDRNSGRVGAPEVFVVGTNGTALGEQRRAGDSFWLTSETLNIPLLWTGPIASKPGPADGADRRPVWLPDVPATIRDLAGLAAVPDGEGISLRAEPAPTRARYAWTWATDDQLGLPPLTAVKQGAAWFPAGASDPRLARPRERKLPDDVRRRLERAGVKIGANLPSRSPAAKDQEDFIHRLWEIRWAFPDGKSFLMARSSKRLLDENKDNLAAMLTRLYVLIATGSRSLGPALADEIVARYPDRADVLHWAGHSAYDAKDKERSLVLMESAVAIGPVEPEVVYDVACVLALLGKGDAALGKLRESIALGYRDWAQIEADPDLASIRKRPGYAAILREHGR